MRLCRACTARHRIDGRANTVVITIHWMELCAKTNSGRTSFALEGPSTVPASVGPHRLPRGDNRLAGLCDASTTQYCIRPTGSKRALPPFQHVFLTFVFLLRERERDLRIRRLRLKRRYTGASTISFAPNRTLYLSLHATMTSPPSPDLWIADYSPPLEPSMPTYTLTPLEAPEPPLPESEPPSVLIHLI